MNTLNDMATSANYALALLGYPTHDVEAYRYFVGDGVDVLIGRILPEEERTLVPFTALKDAYITHYRDHALDTTRPYDGIVELLHSLRENGFKCCVVSNKPEEQVRLTAGHFFSDDLFDLIIGGRPGFSLKPDPGLTFWALGRIGVEPNAAIFAGDTGIDMRTAKNVGCTAVGVTWGFRTRDELIENGADFIIDTPGELLQVIEGKVSGLRPEPRQGP